MEDLLAELVGPLLEAVLESLGGIFEKRSRKQGMGQAALPDQLSPPRRRSHWERRYPQRPSPKQRARLLKRSPPEPPIAS